MTALATYQFPATGQAVRIASIDGEPWFVAADVCAALGIGRTHDALRGLDDDEKGTDTIRTPGGDQQVSVISEPGLYVLIMRSRKSEAKAFRRWVTHDVLPAIRRDGGYLSPAATDDQLAAIIDRAEAQARVLRSLSGIVDPRWLEAKARHVAARALGEEPEIDPATRPLTVGEYLQEKGVTGAALRSLSGNFGKSVKRLYIQRTGEEPTRLDRFVDGAMRPVAIYTEAERDLFDAAWTLLGVAS
jgi:prophage antirepressor-like protein